MLTHAYPCPIPAPTPGPDPLADVRAARAFLLRLTERSCPELEQLIVSTGPRAVAEQLRDGEIPEPLSGQLSSERVRTAGTGAAVDGEAAARCGARLLIPEDAQWPTRSAMGGTVGLWVRGAADMEILAAPSVTLTGSRAATGYGTQVAADVAAELAAAGRTVISGAELGIDGAAHRGALAAHGPTVAVLGCGIDRAYPAAHENLLARIALSGLLVSASPPGATPSRERMLGRGRVLAALGDATVVAEAAPRSGALQAAAVARELGRPVMAVPGPVTSVCSAGSHQLLRQGATLVTSGADVLAALAARERGTAAGAAAGS